MLCLGEEPLEGKLSNLCKVEEWHARLCFVYKECMLCLILGSWRYHEKVSASCDLEEVEREKETNKIFPLSEKDGHDMQSHISCVVGLYKVRECVLVV